MASAFDMAHCIRSESIPGWTLKRLIAGAAAIACGGPEIAKARAAAATAVGSFTTARLVQAVVATPQTVVGHSFSS